MAIIDMDTHFEPGRAWLADHPTLAGRLPEHSTADATVAAIVGDLLAGVPEDERPPVEELLPPGIAAILGKEKADGYGFAGSSMHTPVDVPARLAWLDHVGIDASNVLCMEGAGYARHLDDRELARQAIATCNTWLADQVDGHQRRLMPATSIDATDVEWSIAEMSRMRDRGSRAFLLSTLPGGFPPMHERFEPLWSAAEDLGMVGMVHAGHSPASFDPAWANGTSGMLLRQLGASQGSQSAILMLNGMVFGGVFDRHPNLTVLFAELGIHWFAGAVEHMEARGPSVPESAVYMGRYEFELTPTEFVRRNVRITPLPRLHQSPKRLLEDYPECVVFSSDYAHNESNPEPLAHYGGLLGDTTDTGVDWFLGGNIAECYARMGDPLPV